DVHELRPVSFLIEAAQKSPSKALAIHEEILEGDCMRDGTVVKEESDRVSRGKIAVVGARGIDLASVDRLPFFPRLVADASSLMRSQDGELDAARAEQFQGLSINRGLGQPHAFRISPETVLKISDAPGDLRLLVARIGKRQNRVVISLRQS